MKMLLISQTFAEANQTHQDGVNRFGYSVTLDGRYVCNLQSAFDFPELFSDQNFAEVEISLADFPSPKLPNEAL